eukprot:GEMP01049770.1.p1 GENE.GEMP01049770.1~~GEMP01049770.1.p1  ORF type:complete len:384 (+),score=90.00 GEMP01049770.1:124-1275(+)
MASTARSKKDTKEFFDDPSELAIKVAHFAHALKTAKFAIAFTGAGISTSAGIPDFRSGMNTKLATGPGAWELKAHRAARPMKCQVVQNTLSGRPTYSHMALHALLDANLIKGVISQNVDGLHLRSGIPRDKLAELHGNTNLERCKACKKEYLRDTRVRVANAVHSHETGRTCAVNGCNGRLVDTIVNFGEDLPEKEFDRAQDWVNDADLCLVLGSSLTVTPAADLPEDVGKKKTDGSALYIVNLQKTPLDVLATRINGITDDVMRAVMAELQLPVPEWTLVRYCRVSESAAKCRIHGMDASGVPYAIFKTVECGGQVKMSAPFAFPSDTMNDRNSKGAMAFVGSFEGHYNEPNVSVPRVAGDYRLTLIFKAMPRWIVEHITTF